jgi:hypothetical protein
MLIYSIIENHDYVSEWYTAEGVIIISVVQALIFSAAICILSLSVFLNKLSIVNKSAVLNILSWFLLPIGLITITWIHDIRHSLKYELDYTDAYIYNTILTMPFIISLCWTFIKYRKNNYLQQRV